MTNYETKNHLFFAIQEAVTLTTFSNDVRKGCYMVEQRGEYNYNLTLNFYYVSNKHPRFKEDILHYAEYDLHTKTLHIWKSNEMKERHDPDWNSINMKTRFALRDNDYFVKKLVTTPNN